MATLALMLESALGAQPSGWLAGWAASPRAEAGEVRAPSRDEEAELIVRVRSGDETAANTLIGMLYPKILKCIRNHLPRRTSEEDLVQAVFARIFKKLGQFSGAVPLEHWVSRIAVNTCLSQLKHESRRPELRMGDLSEEQEAVVQNLSCVGESEPGDGGSAARELLDKLVGRLKPDDRLIITLLHLEERSVEEISRTTGWAVSCVKVKAFRARHRLRKLLDTLLEGQGW
jgi:RNA polymerase sigma-70 factor (ECF subfamily)